MDIKDTQIWFKNELFSLKQNLNSKFLSASKDLLCCPPCVKSWPNLTKKLGRSKDSRPKLASIIIMSNVHTSKQISSRFYNP